MISTNKKNTVYDLRQCYQKILRQTFELMLALIHLRAMHKKIYDSKRPYTIKKFRYANI